jgi:hypothetical protein
MHLNSRLSFDLSTERMAPLTGRISIIVSVLHFWGRGSNANPAAPPHSQLGVNHKKPLQTFRPYNIAHRGIKRWTTRRNRGSLLGNWLSLLYLYSLRFFFCDYTRRHSQCTHTHPTPMCIFVSTGTSPTPYPWSRQCRLALKAQHRQIVKKRSHRE